MSPISTRLLLLERRRTKIIATLGPASMAPATIEAMIRAGVNVFRLNMSHGDHATHTLAYERVRELAERLGEPIAIFADLAGPKIRTGRFRGGSITLNAGEAVTVTVREVEGEPGLIPSRYRALAVDVATGARILLDDGALELRVEAVEDTEVRCRVVEGGILRDNKGINLPDVTVSAPSLTEKDREDARFALGLGVDMLALSFVRRWEDIHELRGLIAQTGSDAHIIAKIERPEALEDIHGIIDQADALMVARGDLGVELRPEQVPVIQDELCALAQAHNRPVIVATQMLQSMIESARPTRAEIADVAHAVSFGTDAVMLSGETAVGAYPVEAVTMMDRVARQAEAYLWHQGLFGSQSRKPSPAPIPVADAIGRATAKLSRDLCVRAIIVPSNSGATAMVMGTNHPAAPIIAPSANARVCRRMNLIWGVVPVSVEPAAMEDEVALAGQLTRSLGLATAGEHVLLVRGFHWEPQRNRPSVTVIQI